MENHQKLGHFDIENRGKCQDPWEFAYGERKIRWQRGALGKKNSHVYFGGNFFFDDR